MNGYLLDTCICVFLFRNKFDIAKKLNQIGYTDCYVSEVTLAEFVMAHIRVTVLKKTWN